MSVNCDVYKETDEDWFPSFVIRNRWNPENETKLVRVSFVTFDGDDDGYRVCAWGNDDMGIERDFLPSQEAAAWTCFLQVVGMDRANRKNLVDNFEFEAA